MNTHIKEKKNFKAMKKRKYIENIDSDNTTDVEEDSNDEAGLFNFIEKEETPQEKRLCLAKKYLEEIQNEEINHAEDRNNDCNIENRLQNSYLEKIGKLRKKVAGEYKGYKKETIKCLKHKLHKLSLTCVIVSSDGKFMFTGSKAPFVLKWSLENYKVIGNFDCRRENRNRIKSGHSQIISMCLSSDLKFIAIADGGNDIQIWCPNQLKLLKIFKGHRDVVTCLTFRKGTHQLFSGSKDRSVKIWSLDEMTHIESLFGHHSAITDIDALHRDRVITSGGTDCSIRIWKITEESQLIYNGHRGNIEIVKLISDEHFLSCGDDGSLCIWSSLKKKPLTTQLLIHGKQNNGEANWVCALTPLVNTDLIASGSCDGFIRIWKVGESGRTLTELFQVPIKGFINSLAFTPDGSKLIAAVSQEHRLGRWWKMKDCKNQIVIIEFEKIIRNE